MRMHHVAATGITALTLAGSTLLAGCSAFSEGDGAGGGEVRIATGFYPLQFVSERIGGDRVSVENLTVPGKEPHDLELTIKETAEVAQADLVVVEHGFQSAVDDAVETSAEGQVVDVTDVVDLKPYEDGHPNPHFWQDPLLLADVGNAVAAALTDIDPENADQYAANAAGLRHDLKAVDAAYTAGLVGCQRDTVVVSHDAFGYLSRYGLHFEAIAGLSPDAEPTPADLGRLQNLIQQDGITTVFGERLAPPDLVETLAQDAGVTTAVLDPIEGLTGETEDEDYLTLMAENLAALRRANGCP